MGDYLNIPEFLRMLSLLHEYRGIAGSLNEAADEIERLRLLVDTINDRNYENAKGDDPRNLVVNISATGNVVDKEQFMNDIIEAICETCSCINEAEDSGAGCTHGVMTVRWTDEAV